MSNLLPIKEKKEIKKLYSKRFLAVVFVFVGFLFFSATALIFPTYILTKSNEKLLLEKKNSVSGKEMSALESSLSSSISDINKKLSVFKESSPAHPLTKTVIDPILNAKSSAITISQFITNPITKDNSSSVGVQINGIARDRESLLAFSERLKKIDGISDVSVPISSFLKNSNMSFMISLNAKQK